VSTRSQSISDIGTVSDAGLACPNCGGTQFKVKRSGKAKWGTAAGVVAVGPLALLGLAKASQVKCVTCGTIYKRG